ncbi:MAG TPA: hypothetical protein VJ044_16120, partial [Candidatus Hodarchaeales archaeon]|nr:hypothetical protein [Candidatus Hodarchaeales archaeon]
MPNPRYVRFPIFVASEKENIHGFTYQISLIYYDRDVSLPISKSEDLERLTDHEGNPSGYFFKSWIMARPENSEQVVLLKSFLHLVAEILRQISDQQDTNSSYDKTTHFYSVDTTDIKNIYSAALENASVDVELEKLVEEILERFPPSDEYTDEKGDPQRVWPVPFTPLAEVIRKVIVLPVPSIVWRLQKYWKREASEERPIGSRVITGEQPSIRYLQYMSNQLSLTFAVDYWEGDLSNEELKIAVQYKVQAIRQIYWQLNSMNGQPDQPSVFILRKAPLSPARERVLPSQDLEDLATRLIQGIPDDALLRPLKYFFSIESMMQTNEYFRRISSPLSERRAMGYAMTGLRLIRAEPLQGRQRGFFAYFRTSGPM